MPPPSLIGLRYGAEDETRLVQALCCAGPGSPCNPSICPVQTKHSSSQALSSSLSRTDSEMFLTILPTFTAALARILSFEYKMKIFS